MNDGRVKNTGCPMRDDCVSITILLERAPANKWAEHFVRFHMEFWRKYCLGLVFTTSHGVDFFSNILACLDGTMKWTEEGEYNDNFRKFIKHYKTQS